MKFLLNLPDYYILNALVKSINIFMLKIKFLLLISEQYFNTTNHITHVNSSKMGSYSIFEHYYHKGLYFLQLFLYED